MTFVSWTRRVPLLLAGEASTSLPPLPLFVDVGGVGGVVYAVYLSITGKPWTGCDTRRKQFQRGNIRVSWRRGVLRVEHLPSGVRMERECEFDYWEEEDRTWAVETFILFLRHGKEPVWSYEI